MMEKNAPKKSRLAAVYEQVSQRNKKPIKQYYEGISFNKCTDSPSSECDLVIDDDEDDNNHQQIKKRHTGVRNADEPIKLTCQWADCEELFHDHDNYISHVLDHTSNTDEKEGFYNCEFKDCKYSSTFISLVKHTAFHAYHSKLKNIGGNVLERIKLPKCTNGSVFEIPLVISDYVCEWEECAETFCDINSFLMHIKIHVYRNPKYCKKGEFIKCGWIGCNSKFTSQYKLTDHLRSHTKEKVIACPTCGSMFSTKTKFNDHRKRQLPIELQSYQCSQCSKLFPSERLLRDHMRSHINHYKCTMCDMTCTKPSILAKHIRYRHLTDRPFKCNLCEHSSVSKTNLEQHLTRHCAEKLMACEECNFRCRSLYGLDRHYQVVHKQGMNASYQCHCCEKRFNRGGHLTKHLINKHGFHWPSGHSRFRYKEDADGMFKLETVRYESLEVTQEMMNNTRIEPADANIKYSLEKQPAQPGKPPGFVLMVSEDGDENVGHSSDNNIIIRIDDVDMQGNIVKSQTMEAKEIIATDAIISQTKTVQNIIIESVESNVKIKLEECDSEPCSTRLLRSSKK